MSKMALYSVLMTEEEWAQYELYMRNYMPENAEKPMLYVLEYLHHPINWEAVAINIRCAMKRGFEKHFGDDPLWQRDSEASGV